MRSVQIDGVALPAIEFLYSLVACDNDRWHQKWSAQLALAARPSVVGDTVREDESDFACTGAFFILAANKYLSANIT